MLLRKILCIGAITTGVFCLIGFLFGITSISVPRRLLLNSRFENLPSTCKLSGRRKDKLQQWEAQTKGHIPDFIGIGVRKCGTGVYMNFLKRHGSFSFPIWRNYETEYFTRRKSCGLDWYLNRFKSSEEGKYFMEKTPHYFYASPASVPRDILQLNPRMKVVLLLCDPTIRAFSCFVHHYIGEYINEDAYFAAKRFRWYVLEELPKLQKVLSHMNESETEEYLLNNWQSEQECLIAGLYSVHMKRWMAHFDLTQLLVLNGEDMMSNPGPEYLKLQDFLGVPQNIQVDDWVKHNTTGHFCLHPPQDRSLLFCQDDGRTKARTRTNKKDKIIPSKNVTYMLQQFYKPYNEQLGKILNKDFDWL